MTRGTDATLASLPESPGSSGPDASANGKDTPATGLLCAVGAYLAWGFLPVYWKQVHHVPAGEVLAHRIVWSFVFVALLLAVLRRWRHVLCVLHDGRSLRALLLSTALISGNWGLYIWAVNTGHVTESSLGYYVNPILNVVLARVVLGEKLRPLAKVALVLATVGVSVMALGLGELPWISLALALSFSLYGLVRKRAGVDPLTGLTAEVGFASPFALAFLLTRPHREGSGLLGWEPVDSAWLVGSGVATAVPLLLFATGVARLRYSTVGIVQYISPTCQLALAVFMFGEAFTQMHAITFAFVWTAVALYAIDGVRAALARKAPR